MTYQELKTKVVTDSFRSRAGVNVLSPRRCLNYMSKTLKAAASLYDQRI